MKFKLIFLCFFILSVTQVKAQYYFYDGNYYESDFVYEIGGSIGAINAMTDLGGRKGLGKRGVKDFNIKNTMFSGGLFFSVLYKNAVGLRLEGTFGTIHSYDSILKKVAPSTNQRYERNLSVKTSIAEVALMAEFHPFYIFGDYNDDHYPPAVSPYLLAGVGYFHFNPQAKLRGNYVDLQPLHTEGQGFDEYPDAKTYKLTQINFPVGIGARYDLTPLINIRTEIVYRFLATDYLDDVSGRYIEPSVFAEYLSGTKLTQALLLHDRHKPGAQTAHPDGIRGNPKNNDAYITFSVKLGLTLGRERRR